MKLIKTEQDVDDFWKLIPNEDSKYWPAIGLDLDGTLNTYRGWPGHVKDYDPLTGVFDFLDFLSARFPTLVVITATRPIDRVAKWLVFHGLDEHIDFVSNFKLPCYLYLDDKAVCFNGNYYDAIIDIKKFSPHWEK